jgi:hypothetical protein
MPHKAPDCIYADDVVLGFVNTYAITATAVVNRQCNAEGAAKGGSLGATTEAAMAVHGPVPKGYGQKSARHRCEPWPWNHHGQGSRLVRQIFDR